MNKFTNKKINETIGYIDIINQITIHSPYGKLMLHHLEPLSKNQLIEEYELIEQFINHLEDFHKVESILDHFKNIKTTIYNCKEGKTLDIVELYEIKIQSILMNQLLEVFNCFEFLSLRIEDCFDVIKLLSKDENNITPDFTIYDTYSEKLKEIRIEKRKIDHLYFQSDDNKREELNNLRSKYVILEKDEELKIRIMLTSQLKKTLDKLERNIEKVGHIDLLIGKAKLAVKYKAVKPNLTETYLSFKGMVHPLIKDQVEEMGNKYTKNSIEMNNGATVLTGANMSGKSSVIKTVALNVLLAHFGFFVFAKSASIPVLSGIEYIGNSNDYNMHGLSSFGYEITTINEAIKKMKKGTYLICVDEFARSTNPSEGQKFVKAFALFAQNFPSYTLLATHYDGVVMKNMNHYQIAGLIDDEINKNAIHSLKDFNRFMNYSLKKVTSDQKVPKEAYQVSLLLDIDKDYQAFLDKCYKE